MSKVGRWSTAAGSNNSTPPNGWPEGQLPSTVNDCAREMMASIRTALLDPQFIDQDMTPSYITAASFSVPGNQTSAIQVGRRLKLFDATAGVQQIVYATVLSVSFTAVTTVQIEADSGSLTSSLSSFGLSIISNINNALPRQSDLTVSTIAVTGGLSISGGAAMNGPVQMGSTLSVSGAATFNSTLTVSGAAVFNSTLSVGATAGAFVFVAPNTCKAWCVFLASGGVIAAEGAFNVSSISRSAVGVYRVTFTNPFPDKFYAMPGSIEGGPGANIWNYSPTASYAKFTVNAYSTGFIDSFRAHLAFYHA